MLRGHTKKCGEHCGSASWEVQLHDMFGRKRVKLVHLKEQNLLQYDQKISPMKLRIAKHNHKSYTLREKHEQLQPVKTRTTCWRTPTRLTTCLPERDTDLSPDTVNLWQLPPAALSRVHALLVTSGGQFLCTRLEMGIPG